MKIYRSAFKNCDAAHKHVVAFETSATAYLVGFVNSQEAVGTFISSLYFSKVHELK